MTTEQKRDLRVAVVTGAHPFDVPGFHRLFRAVPGVDAYPQDLDNFAADWGAVRAAYDVVLFYNMHMDDGAQGSAAAVIAGLGQPGQGIVVLHHAILAWPNSAEWSDLCGITDRSFGYHMDQDLTVEIADHEHPITAGLDTWPAHDETYTMASAGAGSHILLTAEHPLSMKTIAWTRTYRDSRVFCFQCGHDDAAWRSGNFAEVLSRGIAWAAGRL